MNAFEQFLASVLNPGGRFSAGTQLASAGRVPTPTPALARAGVPTASDDQMLGVFPTAQAPMAPQAIAPAPVSAPIAPGAPPQARSAPAAPSGGGIGDFLGNIFMPQRAQRNQTVQWLQSQGLDEGTATLLASNKSALQDYLLKRAQGADPMDALKLEKTRLEIEQMRNPTTDDVREYQFARNQGYEGSFTDFMREMKSAGATNVTTNVGGEQTPGWKKIDEAFADTYLSWQSGGFADSVKQLDQLGEALGILESGQDVTGTIGLVPDVLQPFVNEQGTVAREAVEEVVQRNLREILGAQFTEKEGERLISRAFNPRLRPEENAKRVRRLIAQVADMAKAKQAMVDYFDQNGTLRGYTGPRPSMSDLAKIDFGDGGEGGAPGSSVDDDGWRTLPEWRPR